MYAYARKRAPLLAAGPFCMYTLVPRSSDTLLQAKCNQPEVIPANQTLKACTNIGVAEVRTEFNSLIDKAVSVTQVGGLGITEMNTETFSRTAIEMS